MTKSVISRSKDAAKHVFNPPAKKSLGQQDFLPLMVAQVLNQDSMLPRATGELLLPLAQFSNDGVLQMQDSLLHMATSLRSNQALQASALVGRKVLIKSNSLQLGAVGDAKTVVDIPANLSNVHAAIYTQSNELIKTFSLGQPSPGFFQFIWDGLDQDNNRLPEAKYKIEVKGITAVKEITLTTMIYANIDSVSLRQNGKVLKLNVAGVGAVSLDQVRQITV